MKVLFIRVAKAILALPICVYAWAYRAGLCRFETGSCALAVMPGPIGMWWRYCWYRRTLAHCGANLRANWMSVIFMPGASVGFNVHLGPFTSVIDAQIGNNVMIGTNVSVARGARQHAFARLDTPMNTQGGQTIRPVIGNDVWIGTGAVILADVAPGTVVGAGAVVTKVFEPQAILAGVPSRIIRTRSALRVDEADGEETE